MMLWFSKNLSEEASTLAKPQCRGQGLIQNLKVPPTQQVIVYSQYPIPLPG